MELPSRERNHQLMEDEVIIKISGIKKSFGSQEVHRGIDLDIIKGKTTVIVGRSGVGKSVLIKYILGLMKPDSGEILLDGQNIPSMSCKELAKTRSRFGVLFQSVALFDSLDVFDNVALPLREKTKFSESKIKELVMDKLQLLGVADSFKKYPSELSGGMQKRVGLARALQRDPEIVLFDEPTTGLDPDTTDSIYELFMDVQKKIGYTAILVSHDIPKVFKIAYRVAVLQEGRVQACIHPSEMRTSKNVWVQKMVKQIEEVHL